MPPPTKKKRLEMTKEEKERQKALNKNRGLCKTILKVLFSHLGLFLIVALYAIIGAYILIQIELPDEELAYEKKKAISYDMQDATKYIVSYMWYHNTVKHSPEDFRKMAKENLILLHKFIVVKALNDKYDGDTESWDYSWTFTKSLLFTVTTMGAIGYGHIAPKTSNGRLFTMYYGMLGVPLLLLFLANIGDLLASSFRYIYSRLCCRWCRAKRKFSELKKKKTLDPNALKTEEIGEEVYMPTDNVDVPITVNLCVITVYLMLGGWLFSYWEHWEVHSAAYFTFITLTTIGFGDYVPGNSFTAGQNGFASAMKMVVTMLFCLFGMALLSMCINLMQEQIVAKTKWFAKEIGISSGVNDSSVKYQIKKSKEGTVQATDPEKDGNKHMALLNAEDC